MPPMKPQSRPRGTSFPAGPLPPELLDRPYLLSPPKLEQSSISPAYLFHPLPSSPTSSLPCHLCPAAPPVNQLSGWVGVILLPHVVMPLDVNLVKYPLRGLQEVFLHLHGDIPGQEAHEQPLLDRRDMLCQTVRTSSFPLA